MKKTALLLLIPFLFSCFSRKCCQDQFTWSKGKSTHAGFQYNLALSEGNMIYSLGGTNHGAFEMYSIQTKEWSILGSLPVPVSFASGVIWNHSIYILGGIDTLLNYANAFQKFELKQNKWINLPELTTSRSRAASVVCLDKIYLIGGLSGMDDHHAVNSSLAEEYDPYKGKWQKKSDMPTPRHGHSAAVLNDKIIVAGGYTNDGATAIVEEFDPVMNHWTRKADLPSPNGFFGIVAMDNNLYALGGRLYQDTSPIIKYDANADQWTEVGTMPGLINRFGITVSGKHVYIIGGEESPRSVWVGRKG